MFQQLSNPISSYQKVEQDIAVESSNPHQLVMPFRRLGTGHRPGAFTWATAIWRKGLAIPKPSTSSTSASRPASTSRPAAKWPPTRPPLYDYMVRRLIQANIKNQVAILDEVAQLLGEIGSAWAEIGKAARTPRPDGSMSDPEELHLYRQLDDLHGRIAAAAFAST